MVFERSRSALCVVLSILIIIGGGVWGEGERVEGKIRREELRVLKLLIILLQ